jgi:hypothetical protein
MLRGSVVSGLCLRGMVLVDVEGRARCMPLCCSGGMRLFFVEVGRVKLVCSAIDLYKGVL